METTACLEFFLKDANLELFEKARNTWWENVGIK